MNLSPHERIIVALDVSDIRQATRLAQDLFFHVGVFKAGFEFIYSSFAQFLLKPVAEAYDYLKDLRAFHEMIKGKDFLDVKLNDIPNTVGKASKAIASLSPKIFNVHASTGTKSIQQAVLNKGCSQLFGVTVLTSINENECRSIFGDVPDAKVLQFAELLLSCAADGVICSPKEGLLLRQDHKFDPLQIACPNVRSLWAVDKDDQNKERQMTPEQAIKVGIDMLVMGRPITNPPDGMTPIEAAKRIAEEIASVL